MQPFPATQKRLILVCTSQKNLEDPTLCGNCGGLELHAQLKEYVNQKGLGKTIRVVKSGCLDYCGKGPIVSIQPENEWYNRVTREDLKKIQEKWVDTIQH
ncbi:MAG: (2Fe-2S) ferredoxin domain-containing protein [Candidatus Diapherotrites archaeon]|uniref:(2Fe-2S) ferredoxin domain-containing protein n=1 Tax=Candidatus Iainarchaeum sp. TaxID=3101447 RepID=A0A8T4C8A0_9ARCH|nr:(2Fe-2S) ferredoxin domain-containing protein [Candidatus Diapherotrites archaeon]